MTGHPGANDFANKVGFDCDGMATGKGTRSNAEHEDGGSELVEAVDLPSSSGDVLENCYRFAAVWIAHAAQIGDTEHAHEIAFAYGSAIHVLNARRLRNGHDT